ncbi:hypothetical protein C8T65DRAFT_694818 [Cerioporus squamosus]|nr:hypothetical protein C8T65DRAFT_694818 [Cerioporus squamosus]
MSSLSSLLHLLLCGAGSRASRTASNSLQRNLQVLELPEDQFEALLLTFKAGSTDTQDIADRFAVLQGELHQLVQARRNALEKVQGIPAVHGPPHTPEGAEARIVHKLGLLRSILEEMKAQDVTQADLVKEITHMKELPVAYLPAFSLGEGEATVLINDLFGAVRAMVPLREETIYVQGSNFSFRKLRRFVVTSNICAPSAYEFKCV